MKFKVIEGGGRDLDKEDKAKQADLERFFQIMRHIEEEMSMVMKIAHKTDCVDIVKKTSECQSLIVDIFRLSKSNRNEFNKYCSDKDKKEKPKLEIIINNEEKGDAEE